MTKICHIHNVEKIIYGKKMQTFLLKHWKSFKDLVFIDHTSVITQSSQDYRDSKVFIEPETRNDAFLSIGKYCSIAAGVSFYLGGNHNHKRVTTCLPFSMKRDETSKNMLTKGNIEIQNDVWIGDSATILSGVTIGTGSVIGTRALVAKDIEPYSIVVGNPAKIIKKRFDEDTIKKMLKYKWWNLKDQVIIENSEFLFSENLNRFFEMCESFYQDKEKFYLKIE